MSEMMMKLKLRNNAHRNLNTRTGNQMCLWSINLKIDQNQMVVIKEDILSFDPSKNVLMKI